jgi:hypothetical protein
VALLIVAAVAAVSESVALTSDIDVIEILIIVRATSQNKILKIVDRFILVYVLITFLL